ncbi:hypothetical protein PM082_003874 [Marasmius tenuissimus]|nr:hypothetical protein PM082_003874 [Marasmius tenuissimus]
MAQSITKIFGVRLNDSRRRLKRRDSDASVESSGSTTSSSSSSSSSDTSSASTSSTGCSSPSSSSCSHTPLPSPSIGVPEHVHLPDAEVDGMYSYPVNTYSSASSYGSRQGDIDTDQDPQREWRCSPPPERFQLKRMGRGSRGRARPTLPPCASEDSRNHQAQHTERQRDWL